MDIPAWCPQQGARQQPEPAGLGEAGLGWFGAGRSVSVAFEVRVRFMPVLELLSSSRVPA